MKKILIWVLAFIVTVTAAIYQRRTGPTYPKRVTCEINDSLYQLKLVRSLGLDERSEVKLKIQDTSISAILHYKIFRSSDDYSKAPFTYKEYPVNSVIMNKVFGISSEKGFFADVPQQPAAGKIQYYVELTDNKGSQFLLKETPVVIRFKGGVPGSILTPHILIMFVAMLFSTAAGLLALAGMPSYKKYGLWTLILLTIGGMILGPVVQNYAFGDYWTGIPHGWDLTDNKTLIAFLCWIVAVVMSIKKDKPIYTVIASVVLLLVYSVPHSLFGSELNYTTGEVTQGFILALFVLHKKKS